MLLQMALFHSFLWLSTIPLHIYKRIFFIHSFVSGHTDFFHVLATVNSGAMNIGVHVFFLRLCISLVAQTIKRLSTMWETRVRSLGWKDPLEKEMAIHSSTIAWKIPWTEELGRLQSMGSQRVGHD